MRKKPTINPDQLDLFQITEASRELEQRKRTLEENRKRLEAERSHFENTLPPSDLVRTIENCRHPEAPVSRNDLRMIQRDQQSAILMLVLLLALTATFIWFGFWIMQEG